MKCKAVRVLLCMNCQHRINRYSNNENANPRRGKGACHAFQSAEHPACDHKVRDLISVQKTE